MNICQPTLSHRVNSLTYVKDINIERLITDKLGWTLLYVICNCHKEPGGFTYRAQLKIHNYAKGQSN